jgi:hypothetical protein
VAPSAPTNARAGALPPFDRLDASHLTQRFSMGRWLFGIFEEGTGRAWAMCVPNRKGATHYSGV